MYRSLIVALALAIHTGASLLRLQGASRPCGPLNHPLVPDHAEAAAVDAHLPLRRAQVSTIIPDIVSSSLPACASLCAPVEPLISPCRGQNFTAVGCDAICDQTAFDALYACVQCNANESKKEAKLFTPDQAAALRQDQLGIYQECDRKGESIRGRDLYVALIVRVALKADRQQPDHRGQHQLPTHGLGRAPHSPDVQPGRLHRCGSTGRGGVDGRDDAACLRCNAHPCSQGKDPGLFLRCGVVAHTLHVETYHTPCARDDFMLPLSVSQYPRTEAHGRMTVPITMHRANLILGTVRATRQSGIGT